VNLWEQGEEEQADVGVEVRRLRSTLVMKTKIVVEGRALLT